MEPHNHRGFDRHLQERRSANYKPNIWKYDFLQSLTSKNNDLEDQHKKRVEELKLQVVHMLTEETDILVKLELVDKIEKLGLGSYFEEEIKDALQTILLPFSCSLIFAGYLYATALFFRLFRQYSLEVSQDMFREFMDETGSFKESKCEDVRGVLELYEASHLAFEGEQILIEAKSFASELLKFTCSSIEDGDLKLQVVHALQLPYHWRIRWFDVKWQVSALKDDTLLKPMLELAKINFNVVQSTLQKDLKEVSSWWRNLGLMKKLAFARDRLVESFLCAVGVAFEPKNSHLRIWLTKVTTLVLIIDDVYDVYGSLDELHCFTNAVNRWDPKEIEGLPEYLNICLEALRSVTDEIAHDMQMEKRWSQSVHPQLMKRWAEFCEALFVEVKWYNNGFIPSLEEYCENGWVSSSGILLSTHLLLSITKHNINHLHQNQDLLRNISLIIRLCNDLGTSQAEQERGDAASSVLCYMQDANVEEEAAREHINGMVEQLWRRINGAQLRSDEDEDDPELRMLANLNTNMARMALNLYQNGRDKFRDQDGDNQLQFLSVLVQPFSLG